MKLKLYFVKNDWQYEARTELAILKIRSAGVGTDGLVVQYVNDEQLPVILKTLQKIDKEHRELDDVTIDQIIEFKDVPFAMFDPVAMRKFLSEPFGTLTA